MGRMASITREAPGVGGMEAGLPEAGLSEVGLSEVGLAEPEAGPAEAGHTEAGLAEPGLAEPGLAGVGQAGVGQGRGDGGELGQEAILRVWFSASMRRRLIAFARRFVVDHGEAEDVVQETLFRAAMGRRRLRSVARAEAWLFRICRHAAIDWVRSRRVRRSVWGVMPSAADALDGGSLDQRSIDPGSIDEALDGPGVGGLGVDPRRVDPRRADPRRADPRRADPGRGHPESGGRTERSGAVQPDGGWPDLRVLPAHQRLLVVMYYQRGFSQALISGLTGLSAPALRVRLFRARLALAAHAGVKYRSQTPAASDAVSCSGQGEP